MPGGEPSAGLSPASSPSSGGSASGGVSASSLVGIIVGAVAGSAAVAVIMLGALALYKKRRLTSAAVGAEGAPKPPEEDGHQVH